MHDPIRIFGVPIVLAAEAIASVFLDKHVGLIFTAILVIASVFLLSLVIEYLPGFLVKHFEWTGRFLGVRLDSGRVVHGWWYTTISGDPPGNADQGTDGPVVLGGSMLLIKPGRDCFELEGMTHMLHQDEWTHWNGLGTSLEGNKMVFHYTGREQSVDDAGTGCYAFDSKNTFHGGFHGTGLGKHPGIWRGEYRAVTGQRCRPQARRRQLRTEEKRQALLEAHLTRAQSREAQH